MKQYTADRIRNVGLFSHGGAGKTSLAEALLYDSETVNRLGKVEEGTTVTDFDPDEIKRRISVSTALAPLAWRDTKINIIDAPGYADFLGEVNSALRVTDGAVVLIDAAGRLRGQHFGQVSDLALGARIAGLLAEAGPEGAGAAPG